MTMKSVSMNQYKAMIETFAKAHGEYKELSECEGNKIYKTLGFEDGANWYEVTTEQGTEFWSTDNSKSMFVA